MTALLARIGGLFHRAVLPGRVDHVLESVRPGSAGRYHRPGQRALYVSARADWAAVAVGPYHREDGLPRLVVPLEIDAARVVDQRDEAACRALGIDRDASNAPWQAILAQGGEPPSWLNADLARAAGADGIIDRSRGEPGAWHVTLFRWNEPGAPQLRVCGAGVPAVFHPRYAPRGGGG